MPNNFKVIGYDDTNVKRRVLGSSDTAQVPGDLQVDGNLLVSGTTTTLNTEIQTADRFMVFNADYSSDTALDSGLVFNLDPTNAATSAGNVNISAATTVVIPGANVTSAFAANKIFLARSAEDPENNGLYEVHSSSHDGSDTTITIKDASSNTPSSAVNGIVNTQFTANADDDSIILVPVKIGVLKANSAGTKFQIGFGDTASSLSFSNLGLEGQSVAADDISVGDAAVEIRTSSGDVVLDAPSGASVDIEVNNAKVIEVSGSEVDVKQSLHVEDSTAASSTSTGALKVAGGASVAADLYIGDDLLLASDSAILSLGADADATLTHDGTAGLTIAASPISVDSTGSLDLSSTTGDINFQDGGTTQLSLDLDGTAGEVIMQLKVDSDDFVMKQYDGTEVFRVEDNGDFDVAGGAGSTGVTISSAGQITADGRIICDNTTNATSTTDGSMQTDGGLSVALDAVIGDDLFLKSDAAVLNFGADNDVSLTHVADAGLLLNSAMALQFRDAQLAIFSSANGQLDIGADAELEIVAPIVDIDASTAVRISNDLELDSDAAVLKFGADGDVSLTHVADTGLLLNSTMELQFRDNALKISSPADGKMEIAADNALQLDAFVQFKGPGAGLELTAAGSIAIGEILCVTSAGRCDQADPDTNEFTKRPIGVAVSSASDGNACQISTLYGMKVIVKFGAAPASSNLGKAVYLGENGLASLSAPTGSGKMIYQIGYLAQDGNGSAVDRDIIWHPVQIGEIA
jgi:hypothetical protein